MRSYFLLVLVLMSLAAQTQAQKGATPQKFAESITEADLKAHLYILAGKDMEGRETATEGQRKAAAYIEAFFRANNLKPGNKDSYQQVFPVYRDSLVSSSVMVEGKAFNIHADYQPIIQLSHTAGQYFSEVVFAGHGIVDSAYDDYGSLDVRGKAVLILDGSPSSFKTNKRGFAAPNGIYG